MMAAYRIKKSDNSYRYIRFLKCKPATPDSTATTQGGSIAFQDGTIAMQLANRLADGLFDQILDDDDPGLPEGVTPEIIAEKWFTKPMWMPGVETPEP